MAAPLISLLLGYLLGMLSPAKLISWQKNIDLKESGSGNLGATNTMMVIGPRYGALVMVLDVLKAFLAVRIARRLFPRSLLAGYVAGCGAVAGHIYPFYLRFKGGKGVAAMAGMLLACDPFLFLILLCIGVALALICDYGVAAPLSAAVLFPFFEGIRTGDMAVFGLLLSLGILVVIKHLDNLMRIRCGEEVRVRAFLREKLQKDRNG